VPSNNLTFRAPEGLMDQIKSRDIKGVQYPGTVAKRDIDRWYRVLADGLKEVRLDPTEALVLIYYVDTLGGEPSHEEVTGLAEGLRSGQIGLGETFDAARVSLAEKLFGASLAAVYALWDAAERYHVAARRNDEDAWSEDLTFGMALHKIGLHTYDLSPEELAHIERTTAVLPDLLPGAFLSTLEA
jgi:hypothetical protein